MRDFEDETRYQLARHPSSMLSGFDIVTSYGELRITDSEAKPFVALVEKMLNKRLKNGGVL